MGSVYLASSVALGDLCVDPDSYLARTASSPFSAQVLTYYTHCDSSQTNPFTKSLREAKQATDNARRNLDQVKQLSNHLFKEQQLQPTLSSLANNINGVDKMLTGLTAFLDCKPLHKQYVHAAKSLCHLGL